jgi:hypothetical protein
MPYRDKLPGWVPNEEATAAFVASLPWRSFAGAIDSGMPPRSNENALLYRALMTADPSLVEDGRLIARNQSSIGSCVGHGTATGVDLTYAMEVIVKKEPEKWGGRCAADAAYGMSRQVAHQLGNWEGSNGSWAAKSVMEMGTLHMIKYDSVDLTEYNVSQCRTFQRKGLSQALLAKAAEHKIGTAALVRNVDEAKTALQNGYAINVCSNQGFSGRRDDLGFMKAQGSWAHSMCVAGYRGPDTGREGVLIINSWGSDWGSGPFWEDQPHGSFWCVLETFERMLRGGDSFAYSAYTGFPRQRVRYDFLTDFEARAPQNYSFLVPSEN